MSDIAVFGSGAFGTALAIALSRDGHDVTLWGRSGAAIAAMESIRQAPETLGGVSLPDSLALTSDLQSVGARLCLIAVPAQSLAGFLTTHRAHLGARTLVACCKGIDRETGCGPVATIQACAPDATALILTGPSFAVDIARGLPTALLLAGRTDADTVQRDLSRPALRLYRSTDTVGAELGGALKNVMALAAGMAIGAGLGDSARAALIARGFAEMLRAAASQGAQLETIQGLAGLGDLVLTCTSDKSRNFAAGIAFGQGQRPDGTKTIEGMATASAMLKIADDTGIDMPITRAVSQVCSGAQSVADAVDVLLQRPLGKE